MKKLKQKKGIIISFIIGVILASCITAYATSYFAKDVTYKDGKSVEEALNELYKSEKETSDEIKNITLNGEQTLDKYYKNINVNVSNCNNNTNVELAFRLNVKSDGYNSFANICVIGFKSIRVENTDSSGNRVVRAIYNDNTYSLKLGQQTTFPVIEGIDTLYIDSNGTSENLTVNPKVYLLKE